MIEFFKPKLKGGALWPWKLLFGQGKNPSHTHKTLAVLILIGFQAIAFELSAQPALRILKVDTLQCMAGKCQFSGLAWYGDDLILLPQYPGVGSKELLTGTAYSIPGKDIRNYLLDTEGYRKKAGVDYLRASAVVFTVDAKIQNHEKINSKHQGYEAVVFKGDKAFATIELDSGLRWFPDRLKTIPLHSIT